MTLLDDVNATDVHPVLWLALGAIATYHRGTTAAEMVITSLRRAPGPRRSLHSPPPGELCQAADIRRWYLDERANAHSFGRLLQQRFGAWLGVVLEPEWLSPAEIEERGGYDSIAPHLHVELKATEWPRGL
jgi:hypothetical protein